MDLQYLIQISFQVAVLLYTLALFCSTLKQNKLTGAVFGLALLSNGFSLVLRYWSMFPMLPLFQGPFFIPFAVGVIGFPSFYRNAYGRLLIGMTSGLAWTAFLFPNDFYLPLLQFKTPLSHGLFIFGIIGKAFFLLAGKSALLFIVNRKETIGKEMNSALLWGFFFWTLSVFSGAAWSWLGWGSPLVWDDPVIAVSMATWLIYAIILHFHLTYFSSTRAKALITSVGAVWVICLGVFSELGPFRLPGWGL